MQTYHSSTYPCPYPRSVLIHSRFCSRTRLSVSFACLFVVFGRAAPRREQEFLIAKEDIRRNTTAAYRSPEQVDLDQGHVLSEKVDIWALGVILFKLAFFQTPFEDNKGNVDREAIIKGLGDKKVGGSVGVVAGPLFARGGKWLY